MWSHSQRHLNSTIDVRNEVSIKSLDASLARNRQVLEDLSSSKQISQAQSNILTELYGPQRFKCPKVTCFWFHEGFSDAKTRKKHNDMHDRPFRCNEADCSYNDFGFRSSKDLEKHMRQYYPSMEDQIEVFASTRTPHGKTPFACHLCEKRFTRNLHLKSHIRNHNQEKPFACRECGRAFTRSNDCKRHEKLHARR